MRPRAPCIGCGRKTLSIGDHGQPQCGSCQRLANAEATKARMEREAREQTELRRAYLLQRKALSCAEIGQHVEAGAFALKALQLLQRYRYHRVDEHPDFVDRDIEVSYKLL